MFDKHKPLSHLILPRQQWGSLEDPGMGGAAGGPH